MQDELREYYSAGFSNIAIITYAAKEWSSGCSLKVGRNVNGYRVNQLCEPCAYIFPMHLPCLGLQCALFNRPTWLTCNCVNFLYQPATPCSHTRVRMTFLFLQWWTRTVHVMFGATVTQWVTHAGIPFSEVDTSQLWTLHNKIICCKSVVWSIHPGGSSGSREWKVSSSENS